MANGNFKVHNGLEVGPLTISASNGDITGVGNLTLTGDLGVGQIEKNDSSVNINDTGSGSAIQFTVDGSLNTIIAANGITTSESIGSTGNVSTDGYFIGDGSQLTGVDATAINNGTSNVKVVSSGGVINAWTAGELALEIGTNQAADFKHDVIVEGNLTVNGTQTIFNTNNASYDSGLIYLADGNSADILDLGVVVAFDDGTYQHAGFVRDATDGQWKLFESVTDEPTTTINFAQATYANLTVNTLTGTSTQAQYADLAEMYEADAEYAPGTVVHFGGEKEVSQCDMDHCTKVAGVVSTHPAHLMNKDLEAEYKVELALTGRVPCKVTGPVAKGDMMVSAGNGMARAESDPKVGAVIGKALENWEGGEGVIEVVVGKH